jgi:mRNA-degrading endonuclease toxin of MazEF toxin-antitoxin module
MPRQPRPHRGDVWLVSLDPAIGHEIQKTRLAALATNTNRPPFMPTLRAVFPPPPTHPQSPSAPPP